MAGIIRQLIDEILKERAGEDELMIKLLKTKLILNGIDSDKFTHDSADDIEIIAKLEEYARQISSTNN